LVDQGWALDDLSYRERFIDDDDLVFVNDLGQPFEESAMRRRLYAALDAAGLPRIRSTTCATPSARSPCRRSRCPT
jgi:hypothetical protein